MRLNPTSLKYQRIHHRVFGREENRKNLRVSILLEPVSGVRVYLGAGPPGAYRISWVWYDLLETDGGFPLAVSRLFFLGARLPVWYGSCV